MAEGFIQNMLIMRQGVVVRVYVRWYTYVYVPAGRRWKQNENK